MRKREPFDALVRTASRNQTIYIDNYATRYEIETLINLMPILSRADVLDIGCGVGRFSIPLAKHAKRVVGIDTSRESIKLLRAEADKEHLDNVTAMVMDFRDISDLGKFDYVLLVNIIHHIPDVVELLHKIKPLLKKSGTVIMFECNPLNPLFLPFFIIFRQLSIHMNMEYLRSNLWSLRNLINKSGFYITAIHKYALLPSVLYNISPVFVNINKVLNSIPIINRFCAFHIITCKIREHV